MELVYGSIESETRSEGGCGKEWHNVVVVSCACKGQDRGRRPYSCDPMWR